MDIMIFNGNVDVTYSFLFTTQQKFVHQKEMDGIQNPVIIKNKKEICSYWHSALSEFHLEKYFWDNKRKLRRKLVSNRKGIFKSFKT